MNKKLSVGAKQTIRRIKRKNKLTESQIKMLEEQSFTPAQIRCLEDGFESGISEDVMRKIANPMFEPIQMLMLVEGYKDVKIGKVKEKTMEKIVDSNMPYEKMYQLIERDRGISFFGKDFKKYEKKMEGLSEEQKESIKNVLKEQKLTDSQLEILSNPKFTPLQIRHIAVGFDFKLSDDVMKKIADPRFDTFQIRVLECGYRDVLLGYVKEETMEKLTNPSIPYKEMNYKIDDDRIAFSKAKEEKNENKHVK